MSSSNGLDHEAGNGMGEKIDVNAKLAEEVYGAGALSGELDKFSAIGLRLRAFVGKFGAEEGGIERVPPEARTDQHPRGMNLRDQSTDLQICFSSSRAVITVLQP